MIWGQFYTFAMFSFSSVGSKCGIVPLIYRKDLVKKATSKSLSSVRSPETKNKASQLEFPFKYRKKWQLLWLKFQKKNPFLSNFKEELFPDKDSRDYVHSIGGVHSWNLAENSWNKTYALWQYDPPLCPWPWPHKTQLDHPGSSKAIPGSNNAVNQCSCQSTVLL